MVFCPPYALDHVRGEKMVKGIDKAEYYKVKFTTPIGPDVQFVQG